MMNLAQMYSDLGRHADALALFENALKLFLRELPANHPDIGDDVIC
jgi:hypothetical protein